jgi:hypothetical protein
MLGDLQVAGMIAEESTTEPHFFVAAVRARTAVLASSGND